MIKYFEKDNSIANTIFFKKDSPKLEPKIDSKIFYTQENNNQLIFLLLSRECTYERVIRELNKLNKMMKIFNYTPTLLIQQNESTFPEQEIHHFQLEKISSNSQNFEILKEENLDEKTVFHADIVVFYNQNQAIFHLSDDQPSFDINQLIQFWKKTHPHPIPLNYTFSRKGNFYRLNNSLLYSDSEYRCIRQRTDLNKDIPILNIKTLCKKKIFKLFFYHILKKKKDELGEQQIDNSIVFFKRILLRFIYNQKKLKIEKNEIYYFNFWKITNVKNYTKARNKFYNYLSQIQEKSAIFSLSFQSKEPFHFFPSKLEIQPNQIKENTKTLELEVQGENYLSYTGATDLKEKIQKNIEKEEKNQRSFTIFNFSIPSIYYTLFTLQKKNLEQLSEKDTKGIFTSPVLKKISSPNPINEDLSRAYKSPVKGSEKKGFNDSENEIELPEEDSQNSFSELEAVTPQKSNLGNTAEKQEKMNQSSPKSSPQKISQRFDSHQEDQKNHFYLSSFCCLVPFFIIIFFIIIFLNSSNEI